MAFTGTPVVTSLGKNMVHINGGIFLAAETAVTIGFVGSGADVELPSSFPAESDDPGLDLDQLVRVTYEFTAAGATPNEPSHIHIARDLGPPFTITVTNDSNKDSATLELCVQFIHSLVR